MSTQFHQKKVTLNLARISIAAAEIPGLVSAIDKLVEGSWDMNTLAQGEQELLYTSFGDELEAAIKDEFEADPEFLIDHLYTSKCYQKCTLCGHDPIRFEFRIISRKTGKTINCGSECIISHGLHVKGTETAEEARRALEHTIRKQLKKLRLEAWHSVTGFTRMQMHKVNTLLYQSAVAPPDYNYDQKGALWREQRRIRHTVRLLDRFYARSGWLGTEMKWGEWTAAVRFVNKWFDAGIAAPIPFAQSMGKLPTENIEDAMAPIVPVAEEVKAPEPVAEQSGNVEKDVGAFSGIMNDLVLGGN